MHSHPLNCKYGRPVNYPILCHVAEKLCLPVFSLLTMLFSRAWGKIRRRLAFKAIPRALPTSNACTFSAFFPHRIDNGLCKYKTILQDDCIRGQSVSTDGLSRAALHQCDVSGEIDSSPQVASFMKRSKCAREVECGETPGATHHSSCSIRERRQPRWIYPAKQWWHTSRGPARERSGMCLLSTVEFSFVKSSDVRHDKISCQINNPPLTIISRAKRYRGSI